MQEVHRGLALAGRRWDRFCILPPGSPAGASPRQACLWSPGLPLEQCASIWRAEREWPSLLGDQWGWSSFKMLIKEYSCCSSFFFFLLPEEAIFLLSSFFQN